MSVQVVNILMNILIKNSSRLAFAAVDEHENGLFSYREPLFEYEQFSKRGFCFGKNVFEEYL